MRRTPQAIYQAPEELEARIKEREAEARCLPPGDARQNILKDVAQLRIYAEAKRWIESPGLKRGA